MARQKVQKELTTDLPRMKMGEMGVVGLKISGDRIREDLKKELQFPNCTKIYKMMSYDPTIASAIYLYDLMFATSKWKVGGIESPNEQQKQRIKFIEQCMHDMQHSWIDFVQEVGSMVSYGFSVHEKVFRRRLKSNGSKHNDGLIGWSKLPIRSQDTIGKWYWSPDGRELIGLEQDLSLSGHQGRFNLELTGSTVDIPRKKFLLFRTTKRRDNPEGESPLKSAYTPWRYRTAIEETEAIGVQRDLNGLPMIGIPPQYMSEDATPEQKAIYEYYKKVITNIQNNQQSGLVMPLAYDPDSKMPLFKFELLSSDGKKNFDTGKIIERYDNKILTALGADILIMGQSQGGSYNLATVKEKLIHLNMHAKLGEICDVINNDLIPHTFQMNGWTDEELPKIMYDELDNESLEEVSKYIQRVASVGMLERDREALNFVRTTMGINKLPDDLPPQEDILTGNTSRSGDGMAKGSGNGTSDNVAGTDNSSTNLDNSA